MWNRIKTFLKYNVLGLLLLTLGTIFILGYFFSGEFENTLLIGVIFMILGIHDLKISSFEQENDNKILSLHQEIEVKKR